MAMRLGREICRTIESASCREWLVTGGTGSYASGTVAGVLTRSYHGLLVAARSPPLGRTVLLAKLDATCRYDGADFPLFANRWADGSLQPEGQIFIEQFRLEGTVPVWQFALADALIEKRIWMPPGSDTTFVRYTLLRATAGPLSLSLRALVNYRDFHSRTQANNWQMAIEPSQGGVKVTAFAAAQPFYLRCDRGEVDISGVWNRGFYLAAEKERGLEPLDDHLHAASFEATLAVGESLTFSASLTAEPHPCGTDALLQRQAHEAQLLAAFEAAHPVGKTAPVWVRQLVLAADQFIVDRPLPDQPEGKTILAGYHWFGDWGRDTMIALPGLTLSTGRPAVARSILRTFARFVDRGMLPNRFLDDSSPPAEGEYNTADATLWYFEALQQYFEATGDLPLLSELFPVLKQIIDWHERGTRYGICLDPTDGLLFAGVPGVQLTWMDAKVGDWVVTPRTGKPVEINALWYSALRTMADFARQLSQPGGGYEALAERTLDGFQRFWNAERGYCFDVLDGPDGNDPALRPNQLFAVSLSQVLLTPEQQRRVVDTCARALLASSGLRSLAPDEPGYIGHYRGDQRSRDSAYHQGTAWAWLLGPFALAHRRVYGDPLLALSFLDPIARHLLDAGLGSVSEIFEGKPPFIPRGCIAQAWSVAEVLRAWLALQS
ncbi:amylo-alpha-1,6-glucosidase [Gloeobacter kilaueensis]|uniref:Glycogen debranching enzyme n=1 Tax=Gloeobacter kilaueensis (strain ATCC BAA-2537 / CCAP 1431/1 / ULC 316 / JS1) TaxID=1183438 RepID=U5QG34_GLOK1|nr:amylo-alpha-1,6-glucosidase [Gloeobacter kilaueensis]AGY56604.1 glycogen debranching enzyme [Gloeobacter kilaueensis JS1]